jgi:hypothetical protein
MDVRYWGLGRICLKQGHAAAYATELPRNRFPSIHNTLIVSPFSYEQSEGPPTAECRVTEHLKHGTRW